MASGAAGKRLLDKSNFVLGIGWVTMKRIGCDWARVFRRSTECVTTDFEICSLGVFRVNVLRLVLFCIFL